MQGDYLCDGDSSDDMDLLFGPNSTRGQKKRYRQKVSNREALAGQTVLSENLTDNTEKTSGS